MINMKATIPKSLNILNDFDQSLMNNLRAKLVFRVKIFMAGKNLKYLIDILFIITKLFMVPNKLNDW